MTDSLSGHTAAQNTLGADGLRDGDALSSTSLTNILQGVNGNGILRLEDGAYGSTRNATNGQPGAMVRHSDTYKLTITGGYAVLDGVVYEFAGGPGGTATLVLGDSGDGTGGVELQSSAEEALYVIYVASASGEAKVHYEGGSPVNTANGLYPTAASTFLVDYNTGASQTNMKTTVLAVVRVKGGGSGNHNAVIQEINDKRVFLAPSVQYMVPLSLGGLSSNKVATGGAHGLNNIIHLNGLQSEAGNIAADGTDSITALWPSHPRFGGFAQAPPGSTDAGYGQGPSRGADIAGNHVKNELYFAGRNNEASNHFAVRLAGRGVDASATIVDDNRTFVITAEGDSFFVLKVADSKTVTLNPERAGTGSKYKFPEGHIIEVCNDSAGTGLIVFDNYSDSADLAASLSPTHRATFIYEGSKWLRCDYQSAISGAISEITAGTGLTGSSLTSGTAVLNVIGGDGITANADEIEVTVDGATIELSATNGAGAVRIKAGGIDTAHIANDQITAALMADDAINTDQIVNDAVTEDKLANSLLAEIDANTAKVTNVVTNLSISGTTGARTIVSSDGTDAVIPIATTSVAGVMSKAIFDEHTANVAKATNVVTNLSISGSAAARTIESSDGTNAVIPIATTSVSGLLSPGLFDEIDANTAKATNVDTDLTATANGTSLTINSSDGDNVALPAATTDAWGVMTDEMFDAIAANTAKATNVVTNLSISGSTGARTIESSDGTNATIPVATTSVSGVMSNAIFDAVTANTAKNTALTNAQVRTAVEAATDSNVFTDADHTKLNDVTASAVSAAEAIEAVEGESTLLLAGQVNLRANVLPKTAAFSATIAESGTVYQLTNAGAVVVTLPANPTIGCQYVFVNVNGNNMVITPTSGDIINGTVNNTETNATAYAATSCVCVVGGGTAQWLVFGGI